MNSPTDLNDLSPEQLRTLAAELIAQVGEKDRELRYRQTRIDQLTHEISILKRLKFGKRSEQLNAEQASLLDETIDADLAAIETELEQLRSDTPEHKQRQQPKRASLPPQLPRTDIHHEPDDVTCPCGCQRVRIGEDVSEKLDYTPGVFTVERHIRGKWVCKTCETLIQAPVPPHVIDKGIPCALARLKGIGEVGASRLALELFWREFSNRCQVGACVGLVPQPYDSGESQVDQGISKQGNRRVRALLVEMAWCWLRYQPDSALTQWFIRLARQYVADTV